MSSAQESQLIVAVWVTGLVKLLGALLALALVTRWGMRLSARPLAVLGWAAAGLLTLYGGASVFAEALTASGIVKPTQPVDWKPLLWHLYVWDMSFLIWGILFRPGRMAFHPDQPRAISGDHLTIAGAQPGHTFTETGGRSRSREDIEAPSFQFRRALANHAGHARTHR